MTDVVFKDTSVVFKDTATVVWRDHEASVTTYNSWPITITLTPFVPGGEVTVSVPGGEVASYVPNGEITTDM